MKRAYTLVELLIVIMILAVGLVTMLLVLRNATISSVNVGYMTVASGLAQGKIDEILADRITNANGFDYISTQDYNEDPVSGFDGYSITVDMYYFNYYVDFDTPEALPTRYKRVDVTVAKEDVNTDIVFSTIVCSY